ncbi:uncharacterized protein LOC117289406 isoform X2 [Asterias rubens]|uniref:uncharacterized protein LOC117289406 isoform X2 n=1 Tax=Asterias rubens TaxID=7604 RepID=UPI001455C18B|nr:uncharacterized protein LOC117289406 isoform X2 [Asterias rubens]
MGFDALFLVLLFVLHAACDLTGLNAVGKSASQSTSHVIQKVAAAAVDGNLDTFSHTGKNRFLGAVARAGVHPTPTENQQCGLPATEAQSVQGTVTAFLCDPPRTAKFVSFDIDTSRPEVTNAILMLAEVKVKVYTSGECDKDARMKNTVFSRLSEGRSIGHSNPLSTVTATSVIKCAKYCMDNAGCLTFDFARSNGQCHLHNVNPTDIEPSDDEDFSIYGF